MANKIGLSKFIITKSISKNPEDYPDGKSQPHVRTNACCTCSLLCRCKWR